MEQRVYNGNIRPEGLAQALLEEWNRGETIAQAFGEGGAVIVQIGQREPGFLSDEPRQALTLEIEGPGSGVRVAMGQQKWIKQGLQLMGGGLIGFFPFFFAFPLGKLFGGDDVDQRLPGRIWQSVERYAQQYGSTAATGATIRLQTTPCPSCGVANARGAARCSACGASLTAEVPCPVCGFENQPGARFCNQCGSRLEQAVEAGR